VHGGDVAAANLLAATKELPPPGSVDLRAFNIGTAQETDVVTLASMLREVSGSTTPIEHAQERAGEVRRSAMDINKAAQVLGWTPSRTLRDGLAETYQWFAAQHAAATVGA
jgi:UDP-glucose 4-epimerase